MIGDPARVARVIINKVEHPYIFAARRSYGKGIWFSAFPFQADR